MTTTAVTPTITETEIVFPWDHAKDPEHLRVREWLVTNGLGGYASGTLLGLGTRRYHGLFVPNLPAPRGRTMMVPRLDDELIVEDGTVRLTGAEYMDGRREGDFARHLAEFRLDWEIPTWTFEVAGRRLEKRIVMPFGQNTVYVEYRLSKGPPARLHLRPYMTFRMHDGPLHTPGDWPFTLIINRGGRYEVQAFEGAPALRMCLRPQCGAFVVDERISSGVYYEVEKQRGYDHREDLVTPGYFAHDLEPGKPVAIAFSTEPWELLHLDAAAVREAEQQRLQKLVALAPEEARKGAITQLVLAADQFIILPGSRLEESAIARASGDEVRTVIAGYHWFTDWGRDTMISLEGLTLCTGRHREARAILRTFSHYVKDGLLPNHFPEGQRVPIYNTVDATLWYFHAIDRYYEATGDVETLETLFPVLDSIVDHYVRGTQFGIGMDPADGLIRASAPGYQLTWMDAKVDGWVVTPRRGKPVEIQGLWYNALRLMADWARRLEKPHERYVSLAGQAHRSFNQRFWYETGGHLYDVIDGDEEPVDPSLRPNQIFAMSLRHPVLVETHWKAVVDIVTERLLTPYGLRTLDPAHKDYRPRYEGDLWARDAAYHQGLVWAWLIGPFLDAWRRVYPDIRRARALLDGLLDHHLKDGGVGSVSEIFDADPPYTPRGCVAQAWSVAELLRSLLAVHEERRSSLRT